MDKNAETELVARKTIAYAIAYPDIANKNQIKMVYGFLTTALQKKKNIASW